MKRFRQAVLWFIDSGVESETVSTEARYVRFLNATLLVLALVEYPILVLLVVLGLGPKCLMDLIALCALVTGFVLNRRGRYLTAKILVITIMTANTSYFAGYPSLAHSWRSVRGSCL